MEFNCGVWGWRGEYLKKKQNEKKTQTKEGVRVEMEIWQLSLRSQVNASAPGLLRCRVASPPHGATLELPSWTCCWLSVSQQFHHLSCRDCYSSKSNKDFNQSISNSAEIVNFPARWLMEFITKKKKKKKCFVQFCRRSPRSRPETQLGSEIHVGAFHLWKKKKKKKKSWITQVYLVLH